MAYFKLNTDGTIQSRTTNPDGTWIKLELLETKIDGTLHTYYLPDMVDGKYVPDRVKEQELIDTKALEDVDKARTKAMLDGLDYKGTVVSFTKNDGDGLVQVKSGFELGITDTVIHFDNGAKMPINVLDFPDFALWFVTERNKFFVGV